MSALNRTGVLLINKELQLSNPQKTNGKRTRALAYNTISNLRPIEGYGVARHIRGRGPLGWTQDRELIWLRSTNRRSQKD